MGTVHFLYLYNAVLSLAMGFKSKNERSPMIYSIQINILFLRGSNIYAT